MDDSPFSLNVNETKPTDVFNVVPIGVLNSIAPLVQFHSRGAEPTCLGTAFRIGVLANGQSIFVTAAHNITKEMQDQEAIPYLLLPRDIADASPKVEYVPMQVDHISMAMSNNDIALLRIDERKSHERISQPPAVLTISLERPVVGGRTLAIGYPQQFISEDFKFGRDFRASHGFVEELFEVARDSALVNFPSFSCTGTYLPGMSGGPVMNEAGNVIGVVSAGISSPDAPPYGIAALIAGLAELRIHLEADDGSDFLWDVPLLSQAGIIKLGDDSNVVVNRDGERLSVRWVEPPDVAPSSEN